MIINPEGLAIVSAVLLLIAVFALIASNKTFSTRHSATQILVISLGIGGLLGMKGHYIIGITVGVISLVIYYVRWRQFKKDQRFFRARGIRLPECKKP